MVKENLWEGKVAVVTGASSGIGEAIVKRFVEDGLQVVGLARRVEKVQELSESLKGKRGKLFAVKCDVTNQKEIEDSFKWIRENVGMVQILVNNAGLFRLGSFTEGNPEDWKLVLDTNVLGLCMCSKQVLKPLKENNERGHIVHINSVAGQSALGGIPPTFNVYSPSKHAVTCINELMGRETEYHKMRVKITSISPGYVKTNIAEAAGVNVPTVYSDKPYLTGEDIADNVAYVINSPPHVLISELTIKPMESVFWKELDISLE